MELSWFILLLFFPITLIFLLYLYQILNPTIKNLPPGPRGLPLIGNLHQLGSKPHVTLSNLASTYGPLISLRIGTQLVVVASSPLAVSLILKTHDKIFSSRYVPHTAQIPEYINHTLVWSNCTESWRSVRSLCRSRLFSSHMIESTRSVRESKVKEMMGFLKSNEGVVVDVPQTVFTAVFNILGNVIFSTDVLQVGKESTGMKELIRHVMDIASAPNVSDLFPVLAALDLQGLNRESVTIMKRLYDLWDVYVKGRREMKGTSTTDEDYQTTKPHKDFLDVMISAGYGDYDIKAVLLDMFIAGTDTTTSTIEWVMAELIKNPKAMAELRRELLVAFADTDKDDYVLFESKLHSLPYLHACIKETLRLHPPVPLLIPHSASESCLVLDKMIPKGTRVMVNAWALGRDESTWDDPLRFSPDRFIKNSHLDYKGNDFGLVPFGSGRRMCPGLPLAIQLIQVIVACFVRDFEWTLPGEADPCLLDMEEKFSLTLQRQNPLRIIPTYIGCKNG